jgi:uroporphyrinogen-III synthase
VRDARNDVTTTLAGASVVITRSKEQARHFAKMVEDVGGRAILFPVIEIEETDSPELLAAALGDLARYDLAIFVSTNAVKHVIPRLSGGFPTKLKVAAIGLSTKRELEGAGLSNIIAPVSGADSESLLELSEMTEVRGKRIVIFRGNGGRDVLRDTLIKRGAVVEYVECYRRVKPTTSDVSILLKAWKQKSVAAIAVTSVEGLRNLVDIVGEIAKEELQKTPMFVPHERIAKEARALKVHEVIVAGIGDEKMLDAIAKRYAHCIRSFV